MNDGSIRSNCRYCIEAQADIVFLLPNKNHIWISEQLQVKKSIQITYVTT